MVREVPSLLWIVISLIIDGKPFGPSVSLSTAVRVTSTVNSDLVRSRACRAVAGGSVAVGGGDRIHQRAGAVDDDHGCQQRRRASG
jgi:hypothetical protein